MLAAHSRDLVSPTTTINLSAACPPSSLSQWLPTLRTVPPQEAARHSTTCISPPPQAHGWPPLDDDAVRDVSPRRLGRADDLDDVALGHAKVARDGVRREDAGELRVTQLVALEQCALFVRQQDDVLRQKKK